MGLSDSLMSVLISGGEFFLPLELSRSNILGVLPSIHNLRIDSTRLLLNQLVHVARCLRCQETAIAELLVDLNSFKGVVSAL